MSGCTAAKGVLLISLELSATCTALRLLAGSILQYVVTMPHGRNTVLMSLALAWAHANMQPLVQASCWQSQTALEFVVLAVLVL
jgi:hypothetical protein